MENHLSNHHLVAFTSDGQSCQIEPGHIVVRKGDTICFGSIGSDFVALFPDPTIFDLNDASLKLNMDDSKCLKISNRATPGKYKYAAYCRQARSFAKGGSDGEIIIMT